MLEPVLAGFGTDAAIPDPSDAAWPKWVGWGIVIGGAWAIDQAIDMCSDNDNNMRREDEGSEEAGNSKNKRPSNWDKHTNPRPGRSNEKKRQKPGWKQNPNKKPK